MEGGRGDGAREGGKRRGRERGSWGFGCRVEEVGGGGGHGILDASGDLAVGYRRW